MMLPDERAVILKRACGCIVWAAAVPLSKAARQDLIEALEDPSLTVQTVLAQYVRDNWRACTHEPAQTRMEEATCLGLGTT